jgi:hypothetical protein
MERAASWTKGIFLVMLELKSARITNETGTRSLSK